MQRAPCVHSTVRIRRIDRAWLFTCASLLREHVHSFVSFSALFPRWNRGADARLDLAAWLVERIGRVVVQLFLVVIAVGGILRIAKTRGATPWVWGLVAGGGYVALSLAAAVLQAAIEDSPAGGGRAAAMALAFVVPWIPVALVALYVRFIVGRGVDAPFGRWTCQTCRSINEQYALSCESCGAKFAHPTTT